MDKRYDHKRFEEELKTYWLAEKIYSAEFKDAKNLFSIDTPPPTVSGSLHIGHIFSYTQTDFIARFQRMTGKTVFYPMGFDSNGLPTEKFVEKKKKVSAFKLGRAEFIKLCQEVVKEVEGEFKELWQKLGLSIDWDYSYSTISENVQKISQESFLKLLEKGFIYRKDDPALYCTTCRTSVAQAELDDEEVDSVFYDIQFSAEDGTPLLIGTTRPELISSCVALFYHPEDKRYQYLKNKKAIVPIFENQVPVLADDKVDPEKGTGLVMCCTFGDKTDIEWFKKHNLPYKQSFDKSGRWVESTGPLADLKFKEAREKVIELVKEAGLLKNEKPIKHSKNFHERCKHEIEYIVINQWFVNILDYKQKFLDQADKINWYPKHMKSRYINWVENLSWDWCISRQRLYGIPFPVWHCQDCNEIVVPEIKDLPVDPQEIKIELCKKCGGKNLEPDHDVMDTWNTSSLSPEICYSLIYGNETVFDKEKIKKFVPMAMRPQAHDIIRTWAFNTIVKDWMHFDEIPWKDIVISGHVLSADRDKISKSKGNTPTDPSKLMEMYPADVIRFWAASGTLGTDVSFSETQLKIGQKLSTKLWNAFKFISIHLEGKNPKRPTKLGILNEWLISRSSETFEQYQNQFKKFEFSGALDVVEKFFWQDFCDNYLELVKHQLFNPDQYSEEEIEATLWILQNVGMQILQFYAPYMPFLTDSIYKEIFEKQFGFKSIHKTIFSEFQLDEYFSDSKKLGQNLIEIVGQVRKFKSENVSRYAGIYAPT